jgi:hypothetical protein
VTPIRISGLIFTPDFGPRDWNENEGWVSPGHPDAAEGVPGLSGSLRSPGKNPSGGCPKDAQAKKAGCLGNLQGVYGTT